MRCALEQPARISGEAVFPQSPRPRIQDDRTRLDSVPLVLCGVRFLGPAGDFSCTGRLLFLEDFAMGIMNLAEAAARMAAAAIDIEFAKRAALEEACVMVQERAKNLIGVPRPEWPPLAPETLSGKAGINTPLLESGKLRASISHTVIDSSHGEVGSDLDRAVWHEQGTSRVPPRPFLSLAAHQEGPAVAKMVAKTMGLSIAAGLAGSRVHDFFEIARLAGEALHSIRETASDLVESDELKRR
jgi:phage gpG-like protein